MLPLSIQELLQNPKDVFLEASEFIMNFAVKILENPNDEKSRFILVSSKEVGKLLTVKGGIECLFDMGFEEGGEFFIYPMDKDLETLQKFRENLGKERTKFIIENITDEVSLSLNNRIDSASREITRILDKKSYPSNILELEQIFYTKLKNESRKVLYYENSSIQEKARQCIPIDNLKTSAKRWFDKSKAEKSSHTRLDLKDFLLLELLHWFKKNFFNWVNNPNCDFCNGESHKHSTDLAPTSEEKMWDVGIVEGYVCTLCEKEIRFPRFNHPSKLLETRRGRCGEWANCFTLLCRSLGFDARLVQDFTDHAWTEVYSESQKRWIHVDPCEDIWDQPLIYESGWNKKLTYIIAHSHEEIVDVTWRYSSKHQEVLFRRLSCREQWLLSILEKMNFSKQLALHPSRKQLLLERKAVELAEFLSPRNPNENDNKGRTSGSLAWRLQRGEYSDFDEEITKPYVFILTPEEMKNKKFHVKYSSTKDEYVRNSSEVTQDWRKCVYKCSNIFRKIEKDWNMVYLARKEGTNTAHISWKFDFHSLNVVVATAKIKYSTKVFENGSIEWRLCSDDQCIVLPSGEDTFASDDLTVSSTFCLEATLSGGRGNCSWQHTQLFRQSLLNDMEYSFDICINFK